MNTRIRLALFLFLITAALLPPGPAAAQIRLVPAYGETSLLGPERARGAVVWSHGRSIESEDSEAPTPLYMKSLRLAGWDVYRLDRMRVSDTLTNSARALAGHAERLRARGYRSVSLTGQSFGAFISLLAAGQTDAVDSVVGTAPAAFGNFIEAYDSFRENATRLWPILRDVRSARVMLFFFHGDDFDPGGRGEQSRLILASRGLDHTIIDQPANLLGHGAANTGLFVRRFADCIVRFADRAPRPQDPPCDGSWGRTPSADLMKAGLGPAEAGDTGLPPIRPFVGTWYGTYLNGREVVLSVGGGYGTASGTTGGSVRDGIVADYLLGPGVEPDQGMERVRRYGRIENGELVFDEAGRNVLRYRLRPDGKLAGLWLEKAGEAKLETVLRRVQ